MDDYLPEFEQQAQSVLNFALENLEIDKIRGTIAVPPAGDATLGQPTFDSYDGLHRYLMEIYDEQWYAYAPFEGGEAVFESDSWSAAEEAMDTHPELQEFFDNLTSPPDSEELVRASELLKEGVTGESVVMSLSEVNDELIAYLAKYPEKMRDLEPRQFEELIADMFKNQGYNVELTPLSRDGGRDVIAVRNDCLGTVMIYTECKRYAAENKVGVQIARGLYGVIAAENVTRGVIATTSSFTKDAIEYQQSVSHRLSLADFDVLKQQIQEWKA